MSAQNIAQYHPRFSYLNYTVYQVDRESQASVVIKHIIESDSFLSPIHVVLYLRGELGWLSCKSGTPNGRGIIYFTDIA